MDYPTMPVAPVLFNVPGGKPDLDAVAREAAQEALLRHVGVRVRLQPQFLVDGDYRSWSGVVWGVDLPDLATCQEFREDLDRFIRDWVGQRTSK